MFHETMWRGVLCLSIRLLLHLEQIIWVLSVKPQNTGYNIGLSFDSTRFFFA